MLNLSVISFKSFLVRSWSIVSRYVYNSCNLTLSTLWLNCVNFVDQFYRFYNLLDLIGTEPG